MTRMRILLCEREVNIHSELKAGFEHVFSCLGYEAIVVACEDTDTALRRLASREYDVLVTDLAFGVSVSTGLDFVKHAKSKFPDIYVIACTSGTPNADEIRINQPSFDQFVPKRCVMSGNDEDTASIVKEIENKFLKLTSFSLRTDTMDLRQLKVRDLPLEKGDLYALVAQAYGDLQKIDPRFRPTEVVLTPITGGFSGSLVFAVELRTDNKSIKFVRTALKVSLHRHAKREVDNFNSFAKWMLPYNRRTEMAGAGYTRDFGAIAYSFVLGGEDPFDNFVSVIKSRDMQQIEPYIDQIFDYSQVNFYQDTRDKSERSISQHYRERYFPDSRYVDNQQALEQVLVKNFQAERDGTQWKVKGEKFPDPFRVFFNTQHDKFTLSVCHGDLNAHNIICSSDKKVAYIDFQDTGLGHIFQDFAALENSIRLDWDVHKPKKPATWPYNLIKLEKTLLTGSNGGLKSNHYGRPCRLLREIARSRFPDIPDWEYIYAASVLALKLLRLPGLNDFQKARLTACVLVGAQALQDQETVKG